MNFDKLKEKFELIKASLNTKKIDKQNSDKLDEDGGKKLKHLKHMNGKNTEMYNYEHQAKADKEVERMSKGDNEAAAARMKAKYAGINAKTPDPMKVNTRIDAQSLARKKSMKKEEHEDEEEDRKLINDIVDDKIDAHNRSLHSSDKKKKVKKSDLVKALDDAGHRESALLLKNWGEMDDVAEEFFKSNYGPKGMSQYRSVDNIKRKASRTGEELEHVGQNKAVRSYTTMGASMQRAHDAAQQKAQEKKQKDSVKTLADMSDEEKKALEAKYGAKIKKEK